MPRLARLDAPGVLHHIIIRGIECRTLFGDDFDRENLQERLSIPVRLKIMLKHLVFAVVITAILSCGQNEPLTDYEAKSLQEQALKSILLDFQDGVNSLDSNKVVNLIHEKASIMTGRDQKKTFQRRSIVIFFLKDLLKILL